MFEILRIAAVETEDQVIQDSLLLESDGLVNFVLYFITLGKGLLKSVLIGIPSDAVYGA